MNELVAKRKVQLDQLSEGLASLGFSDILSTFTEIFKPVFVGGKKVPSAEELLSQLECDFPHTSGTYEYLQGYLRELDEKGIY